VALGTLARDTRFACMKHRSDLVLEFITRRKFRARNRHFGVLFYLGSPSAALMVIACARPERVVSSRRSRSRGSNVICFLTSLRPNVPGIIADDSVRVFFDHLSSFRNAGEATRHLLYAATGAVERSPGGWCRSPRVLSEILRTDPVSGPTAPPRSSRSVPTRL